MKLLRPHQAGLTLIELMIVAAIIALLASLAIPGYIAARNTAQRGSLLSEIRQNSQALDLYASDNNGLLPPTATATAVVPTGLDPYLPRTSTWQRSHPIGATWGWANFSPTTTSRGSGLLLLVFAGVAETVQEHALAIDRSLDDGALTEGSVRFIPAGNLLILSQ